MSREAFVDVVRRCVLEGDYTLKSGRHSDHKIDLELALERPQDLKVILEQLERHIPAGAVVVGEGGAYGFAKEYADRHDGTPYEVDRAARSMTPEQRFRGRPVFVVEDVVTTGGTVNDVATIVHNIYGGNPRIVGIVRRGQPDLITFPVTYILDGAEVGVDD